MAEYDAALLESVQARLARVEERLTALEQLTAEDPGDCPSCGADAEEAEKLTTFGDKEHRFRCPCGTEYTQPFQSEVDHG